MVPASSSMVCDLGVHQMRVAAARRTCSVANVSDGWFCATRSCARLAVSSGTRSMSERTAPPCVKAACASELAEATLETSSQMLPVSESHWADEPESGSGREGSAVPGRASVRV